ncbi:hypothetical protein Tco_0527103 [Tanacetum coccineum]
MLLKSRLNASNIAIVLVEKPICLRTSKFPSVGVFDELLEEIHVTQAHLEKKRTRLRLYTKSLEEIIIQTVEMASPTLATALELDQDGVRSITTASECSRLNLNPRSFIEATTSGIL